MRDYLPHGSAVACRVLAIASGVVFAVGSVPPSAATTQFKLSVSRQGYGSGTVTSAPGGINCGSTCSHKYDSGTEVTLTAHPNSNSHLDHWSACSGSAPTCKVTISEARAVIASFARTRYRLYVAKTGSGGGTVTSSPGGIGNCSPYCSHDYDPGTHVTLTAHPDSNSTFAGWSGDCTGTGTCHVTMSQGRSVTAHFTKMRLSVSKT